MDIIMESLINPSSMIIILLGFIVLGFVGNLFKKMIQEYLKQILSTI